MANSYYSLTDLIKINDRSTIDAGLTDILNDAPSLKVLPAIPATHGTVHKYVRETTSPTTAFRAINAGRDNSPSSDTEQSVSLQILDASFVLDKAAADSYIKGPEALIAREAARNLRSAMFTFEKQLFNGTLTASGGDSAGFSGLANSTYIDALADVTAAGTLVNAGGTTATTGSSVYFIRAVDDREVALVLGQSGQIVVSESTVQMLGSTTIMPVYATAITGYVAAQLGGKYSVVRIGNLTADSGKGLTDTLLYQALALFPAGRGPTHCFMNRRSMQQLRASRTATNATGAAAPFVTEIEGIPVIVTDAISSVEALLA